MKNVGVKSARFCIGGKGNQFYRYNQTNIKNRGKKNKRILMRYDNIWKPHVIITYILVLD